MPSKLAILLAAPSADEYDDPDWDAVRWCDSKLDEVREVLTELVAKAETEHVVSSRVHALIERLKIDPEE